MKHKRSTGSGTDLALHAHWADKGIRMNGDLNGQLSMVLN